MARFTTPMVLLPAPSFPQGHASCQKAVLVPSHNEAGEASFLCVSPSHPITYPLSRIVLYPR